MSFGAPGGGSVNIKPTPVKSSGEISGYSGLTTILDDTGECKHVISGYLKCIKLNRGTNDEACRKLAKDYLACRMDKNLMAPEKFENLGLVFKGDEKESPPAPPADTTESKK
ncbi:unnamed protein product [Penicillium salamii]|uniref:Cytochrome c oxidase assembly protein COX19 n=1 Tax=Penicillium salamii TaxID=1612424 RepID=A0A9W4I7N1_9EURO|nr:unnamed protein product [Penicillium salamii]CAG8157994.1 unnamed protein product [Penicillium salamii]CAG8200791.1 unnamed protein product [Penicillium salamii]CAG8238101.1 unnamed protein product [Penicillium salamii]CAG8261547.1 unnamed protein product [Penicillium salamii]